MRDLQCEARPPGVTRGEARAPRPGVWLARWLWHANVVTVLVLLLAACMWLWMRPHKRPVMRRLIERGRVVGSLRRYLRTESLRIVETMPWMVVGILVIGGGAGALIGLLTGGLRWWWLFGPPSALLGAALAPAWGETVARWASFRPILDRFARSLTPNPRPPCAASVEPRASVAARSNSPLSIQRATSVRGCLVARGRAPYRIMIDAMR